MLAIRIQRHDKIASHIGCGPNSGQQAFALAAISIMAQDLDPQSFGAIPGIVG